MLLGMGITGSSNAFTIPSLGGVDVGIADTLLTQLPKSDIGPMGDSQLETWINDYFSNPSPAITYSARTEDFFGYATNDSNYGAYALVGQVDYYILHNAKQVALFENKASLDWAVFNWSVLDSDFNIKESGAKISFIAEFNANEEGGGGSGGPVPEPSQLALLAAGLLGMGASRLRKTKV
jgi:hypothetical protein